MEHTGHWSINGVRSYKGTSTEQIISLDLLNNPGQCNSAKNHHESNESHLTISKNRVQRDCTNIYLSSSITTDQLIKKIQICIQVHDNSWFTCVYHVNKQWMVDRIKYHWGLPNRTMCSLYNTAVNDHMCLSLINVIIIVSFVNKNYKYGIMIYMYIYGVQLYLEKNQIKVEHDVTRIVTIQNSDNTRIVTIRQINIHVDL